MWAMVSFLLHFYFSLKFFLGYVLPASDQRALASMRVQAIGVFVSYVPATD